LYALGKIANKIANQIQNYQISGEISNKKLQHFEMKLPNFGSFSK
jgi:hypothetical protein